jgi:hypothetical protein
MKVAAVYYIILNRPIYVFLSIVRACLCLYLVMRMWMILLVERCQTTNDPKMIKFRKLGFLW